MPKVGESITVSRDVPAYDPNTGEKIGTVTAGTVATIVLDQGQYFKIRLDRPMRRGR